MSEHNHHHYCTQEKRITTTETLVKEIKDAVERLEENISGAAKDFQRGIKSIELHLASMAFGEHKQFVRDISKDLGGRVARVEDEIKAARKDYAWLKRIVGACLSIGLVALGFIWEYVNKLHPR